MEQGTVQGGQEARRGGAGLSMARTAPVWWLGRRRAWSMRNRDEGVIEGTVACRLVFLMLATIHPALTANYLALPAPAPYLVPACYHLPTCVHFQFLATSWYRTTEGVSKEGPAATSPRPAATSPQLCSRVYLCLLCTPACRGIALRSRCLHIFAAAEVCLSVSKQACPANNELSHPFVSCHLLTASRELPAGGSCLRPGPCH